MQPSGGPSEADALRTRLARERLARREAEAIAEQATRRLYESDQLKSRFVAHVSHELRTPLAAVVGFADILSRDWDDLSPDRRREVVDTIARNAAQLRDLIENLLDFSRVSQEGLAATMAGDVACEPTEVSSLVLKALVDLAPTLENHRVSTIVEPEVIASVDPDALLRLLANLLDNAVKYSPVGSQITVTLDAGRDTVVLAVADEGPGIPADERGQVFESFYRSDSPERLRTRGLGIGLSVVRSLAEAMYGSVYVDDVATGTRLVVRLVAAEGR
jgi:two-component system OmpR family sensor kinase